MGLECGDRHRRARSSVAQLIALTDVPAAGRIQRSMYAHHHILGVCPECRVTIVLGPVPHAEILAAGYKILPEPPTLEEHRQGEGYRFKRSGARAIRSENPGLGDYVPPLPDLEGI